MIAILALIISIMSLVLTVGLFFYFKKAFNENAFNLQDWASKMNRRTEAMEEKLQMYR